MRHVRNRPAIEAVHLACLHTNKRNGLFGGPILSSQSEQFIKLQKALIGWGKAGPPNSQFGHVNKLIMRFAKIIETNTLQYSIALC